MDSFIVFWLIVMLLTILFVSGLIYLAYWISKRYGKKKLGIWLVAILIVIVLTPILSLVLEDYLFFKSDAIETLNEHQITLQDDFELVSNEMLGITNLHHQFELEISPTDKERIIDFILKSENYKESVPEMFDMRADKPRYSDQDIEFKLAYQDKWNYVYEFYKPYKRGYTPTWDRILISKDNNRLTYKRVLD